MKGLFSILFLFFISPLTPLESKNLIEDGNDFNPYQKTLSYEQVQDKIEHVLKKDVDIERWYTLTSSCLKMYASPDDKLRDVPEFTLYLGSLPKPKRHFPECKNTKHPLAGLKIAIDPGHIGGQYARLEERYIDLLPRAQQQIFEPLTFHEGALTTRTAEKLKRELEALGAIVLLTKTAPGETVIKKPFEIWLKEDFNWAVDQLIAMQANPALQQKELLYWKNEASPTDIFRATYNYLDLEERAEKINAFNPHLTLSCHYNLGGDYDKNGKNPGIDFDYTLFFVPGAFKKGTTKDEAFKNASLKKPRARYEFIRLLVTQDIEESVEIAKIALRECQNTFKLPTGDDCAYLNHLSIKHSPGIYYRNLTLNRLVHSPILYGEPLCQDNFINAKILATNPDLIIDKVVTIYKNAIVEWALNHSSQK